MPLSTDRWNLLERIRHTDEARPAPCGMPAFVSESAIVVTATHAEAHALGIEAHERQQYEIEPAGGDRFRAFGLDDSQVIDGLVRADGRFHELHADRAGVDAGQEDPAAALARKPDQRRGIELFGKGCVDRHPQAWPQA